MRATGIVKGIDDLGRIVIPKDIRRALKIREGEPMEIFVEKDSVILKKFNSSQELKDELSTLVELYEVDVPSDIINKIRLIINELK